MIHRNEPVKIIIMKIIFKSEPIDVFHLFQPAAKKKNLIDLILEPFPDHSWLIIFGGFCSSNTLETKLKRLEFGSQKLKLKGLIV